MCKVKIFRERNEYDLEDAINNFLAQHKYGVNKIMYQMHADVYSAMIVYSVVVKE